MDLLIVRHAIAFERNPKRWPDDGERPLSPEGMRRARKAATGLKRIANRPVRVLTSGLLRARQTAAILTEFAGWPKAVECAQLSPAESPQALLDVLRGSRDKCIATAAQHVEQRLRRLCGRQLGAFDGLGPPRELGQYCRSLPRAQQPACEHTDGTIRNPLEPGCGL